MRITVPPGPGSVAKIQLVQLPPAYHQVLLPDLGEILVPGQGEGQVVSPTADTDVLPHPLVRRLFQQRDVFVIGVVVVGNRHPMGRDHAAGEVDHPAMAHVAAQVAVDPILGEADGFSCLYAILIVDQHDLAFEVADGLLLGAAQLQVPADGAHAELALLGKLGGPAVGEGDAVCIHGGSEFYRVGVRRWLIALDAKSVIVKLLDHLLYSLGCDSSKGVYLNGAGVLLKGVERVLAPSFMRCRAALQAYF